MGRAADFADALQRLETDGDLDAFVARFAEDVELVRPEPGNAAQGREGARAFWSAYLGQFETVRSTFSRVVDGGDLGELEWVSTGRLRTGSDITYAGVSLLTHDADGAVTRFATYYDTSAFTRAV